MPDAALRRRSADVLAPILPIANVLIVGVTALLVLVGPAPTRPASHPDLTRPDRILVEPTDRLVLLAWWASALLLLLWIRGGGRVSPRSSLALALPLAGTALAVLSVVGDRDASGLWGPVSWWQPLWGLSLLGWFLLVAQVPERTLGGFLARTAAGVLVLLLLLSLLAAPAGVRDYDSFRFAADELLAPALGAQPYLDYAAQYSGLLGYPVSQVALWFPQRALWVVLLAVLLLQVVTLRVIWWSLRLTLVPAVRPLALALVVAPVVATTAHGYGMPSYIAGLPLRLFLPVACLAYAHHLLVSPHLRHRSPSGAVRLGALTALAAVHNPEFGLPVLPVLLLALWLRRLPGCSRSGGIARFLLGFALTPLLLGAAAVLAGTPPQPAFALVFQRIFGAVGFFNVAMPAVGLHGAMVAAFVSAVAVGVGLLRQQRAHWEPAHLSSALLLLLVGSWSLLCLPYYAGRSVTPNMLGSFGLQLGWLLAAALPLAAGLLRTVRVLGWRNNPAAVATLAILALLMVADLGQLATAQPRRYLASMTAEGNLPRPLAVQVQTLRALQLPPGTDQLLDMPATTALVTGVPAHTVVSNPEYLQLSRRLAALQCQRGWPASVSEVVLDRAVHTAMARVPACQARFASEAAAPLDGTPDWVLVSLR